MSTPTDIYQAFSRELLENFVWQLQNTPRLYDRAVLLGREPGSGVSLTYRFECPSQASAEALRDYIHQQSDEAITIGTEDGGWVLTGRTSDFAFDLSTIMQWVGYMCDAGNESGCRFDGWNGADAAEGDNAEINDAEEPEVADEPDAPKEEDSAREKFPHLVIARILDKIKPIERGEKYEDPLSAALGDRGEVTGGGSQLTENFEIDYVDVEIYLADLDSTLELTRQTLKKLGVPPGSELRFARECVIPIDD